MSAYTLDDQDQGCVSVTSRPRIRKAIKFIERGLQDIQYFALMRQFLLGRSRPPLRFLDRITRQAFESPPV